MKEKTIHIIDDNRVGGVTASFKNFEDLNKDGHYPYDVLDLNTKKLLAPRIKAAIIIIHYTLSWRKIPFYLCLRLRSLGKKLIIHEHSYTEAYEKIFVNHKFRFHLMLKLVYALADKVVAVSHAQRDWIKKNKLCVLKKLECIQQYKDYPDLEEIKPPTYKPGTVLKLLAFGRFHQQKGFDIAIEAFKKIPPETAELTLAGYGEDEERHKQQAKGYSNIRFSGKFKSPKQLLEAHHVVLIPSRWEAFGQIAVEARAAARPVIASRVDGLTEQIKDVGFLVPSENPQALADKIIELSRRQDLKTLGLEARNSIKKGYQTWLKGWRLILDSFMD